MKKEKAKKASDIFEAIMKASVEGNPKPKRKTKGKKKVNKKIKVIPRQGASPL